MSAAVAVFGIGNPDRGDDAVGRTIAQSLQGRVPEHVTVIEHSGEATSLLARLSGLTTAILIDACHSGAAPGTVHRFEVHTAPLPQAQFGVSTHDFGLATALELARALGELPPTCIVYAIEGADFSAGAPLSAAVAAAVAGVTKQVVAELSP